MSPIGQHTSSDSVKEAQSWGVIGQLGTLGLPLTLLFPLLPRQLKVLCKEARGLYRKVEGV